MFKNQNQEDFKKIREGYTIELRKNARQQIISKRRVTNNNSPFEEQSNQTINEKNLIIDKRYQSQIKQFFSKSFTLTQLPQIINCLYLQDIIQQHYAIIGLRKIISVEIDPPIQTIIDKGLIPRLIQFVKQNKYPQIQLEAAWVLTNVASGNSHQTQSIIQKGAIPLFTKLLLQNNPGIVQQAVWAIGNIAGDRIAYRDQIIKNGGIQALVKIVQKTQNKILIKQGCWAISNLCRGLPLPAYNLIHPSVEILCQVVKNKVIDQKDIEADCCWALANMSQGSKPRIQKVVDTGIVPTIIQNAKREYYQLAMPCIRIIGNIASGNQLQTQTVLVNGGLQTLEYLLDHHKKNIRRQACWVLSNIAAGTSSQVNLLISKTSLLQKILKLFESDAVDVKKQICWIFSNMYHLGEPDKVFKLYKNYSIIRYYINFLYSQDVKLIEASLESLYNVLGVGEKNKISEKNPLVLDLYSYGAIDILQKLQEHPSESVYKKVTNIIQGYFQIQDPLDL